MKNAKWITSGALPSMLPKHYGNINGSIYFRKSFNIKDNVQSASLSICALGLGEYRINGMPVSDEVLCTPFTKYDARVIYKKYEISHLLKTGENAIGVHVGNGFYNNNMSTWNDLMASWKDKPKLYAKINIIYTSGECDIVKTDTSWKCIKGSAVYNHMRQGEHCDARLRQCGYDNIGFDDSNWDDAVIANEPGGLLETTDMPPVRVIRTLNPITVKNDIYDFGENISGWARIRVKGESGQEIKIIYDENFEKFRQIRGNTTCFAFAQREQMPLCNEDIFVCSGIYEEFRPTFCYHGFRYVKVENAPADFEITAEVVHTDLKCIGSFESSSDMLNKIHEASVRATLSNFVWHPTDCPHREQLPWTNDAQLSSEQVLMNFDAKDAYQKWMNDFKDAQRPNGHLPGIIPSAGWGYNWGHGPGFGCAVIIIPWNTYINTGSADIIRSVWTNMVRYIEYIERMSDDYVVDFGLGDWMPVNKPACDRAVIDTAYFYSDCVKMARMATVIGEDADYWQNKSEYIKHAWRSKFLGNKSLEKFQTFYACAIYNELLEDDEVPVFSQKLAELVKQADYHIDCGIFGTKFIFSALSDNGYADVVYKMVTNPTYPSYAYWINNGQTTLCESWDMLESCNHHMYSEVDHWLYRHVGGIRYTDHGIVIKPSVLEDVEYVKVEHKGITVIRNRNKLHVFTPVELQIVFADESVSVKPGEYQFDMNRSGGAL